MKNTKSLTVKYMLLTLACLTLSVSFVNSSVSRIDRQFLKSRVEAYGGITGPQAPFKKPQGAQANSSGAIQT